MPGLVCYDFRDGHHSHQYCCHVDRKFYENPTVQLFTFYKDLFVYSQWIALSGDQYILSEGPFVSFCNQFNCLQLILRVI